MRVFNICVHSITAAHNTCASQARETLVCSQQECDTINMLLLFCVNTTSECDRRRIPSQSFFLYVGLWFGSLFPGRVILSDDDVTRMYMLYRIYTADTFFGLDVKVSIKTNKWLQYQQTSFCVRALFAQIQGCGGGGGRTGGAE